MQECCVLQDKCNGVQPRLLVPGTPVFSLPLGQVLLREGHPWELVQGGLGWDTLLSSKIPRVHPMVVFTELPEWVNSTQRGGCLSGLWEDCGDL